MAKLARVDKDIIIKHFAGKADALLQDQLIKIGEALQKAIDMMLPDLMKDFLNCYPTAIARLCVRQITAVTFLHSKEDEENSFIFGYRSIPLKGTGIPFLFEEDYIKILRAKFEQEIVVWREEVIRLVKLVGETKNRTACALENVNTEKQLKDNFPEAYKILMQGRDNVTTENKCDTIENTRAFLSSIK